VLAANKNGAPIEVFDRRHSDAMLRKATDEPEVMPAPSGFNAVGWNSSHT
jgi:hypothetical protein